MIIRLKYLFIGTVLCCVHAHAQIIKGEICTKEDTLSVWIKLPFYTNKDRLFEKLQKQIMYYDSSSSVNEKTVLPDQARWVRFVYEEDTIKMISKYDPKNKRIFLRILIDGKIRLYNYYGSDYRGGGAGSPSSVNAYSSAVLQRKGQPLYFPDLVLFRTEMSEYFSDCSELVQKIKNRELTKRDFEDIVLFYNSTCGKE